jgi:PTS system ascorbate-specific IIC component
MGTTILNIFKDIMQQPAFIMGLFSFIGLIVLKKPAHLVFTGTIGPVLGYVMLSAGAGIIVLNLDPLAKMIEEGFKIKGVVPNNEAVVALAQGSFGFATMMIFALGYVFNLFIALTSKYKYVFLTGHHSFFMACAISVFLHLAGFEGWTMYILGGFFVGAWSAISPAVGQRQTNVVTSNGGIAMGHFGALGYYLAGFIGKKIGDPQKSADDIKIPESLGFLRDTTISTALVMIIFYVIAAVAAGSSYVEASLSNGTNFIVFAVMSGLQFAIGVNIVYAGVRMIVKDLVPSFKGLSEKLIKGAVPAVDCAVFFTFSQNSVVLGFIISFIGGIVSLFIMSLIKFPVLIIPSLVPHFFCGGTAGVYANKMGGVKGLVAGSFVHGVLISFLSAFLFILMADLGFSNTTFGDTDFAVLGIIFAQVGNAFGQTGIYLLAALALLSLYIPSFVKTKSKVINNN